MRVGQKQSTDIAQRRTELVWWLGLECVVFGYREGSGIYSSRVSISGWYGVLFRIHSIAKAAWALRYQA